MPKFPYAIDVEYESGRSEVLKVRTSADEKATKAKLSSLRGAGLVKSWKARPPVGKGGTA